MNTRLRSESTTTLCSVGYGSLTTRTGATSPPAMVALSQPGGHRWISAATGWSSRHPFSSSSAWSRASNVGVPATGQMVPSVSPDLLPLGASRSSPAHAIANLRITLLTEDYGRITEGTDSHKETEKRRRTEVVRPALYAGCRPALTA